MKIILLAILAAVSMLSFSAFAKTVTHVVLEDETAWFLAHVYYGSGKQFTKLLSSNGLSRAEDMKTGMQIKIDEPKYSKDHPEFTDRYNKLWAARQKALGLTKGEELPNSKVVIPTEKIRNKDQSPKLPFSDLRDSSQSAADLAKKELLKGSRSSEEKE